MQTMWTELSGFLRKPKRTNHPFFEDTAGEMISCRFRYMEPLFQYVKWKTEGDSIWNLPICQNGAGKELVRLYYEQLELVGQSAYSDFQEAATAGWSAKRQIQYLDACVYEQYAEIWHVLLDQFEVLRDLVCKWTSDFILHVRRILIGLQGHYAEIEGLLGHALGPLAEIGRGDSDIHEGECVHILCFRSGDKIMYKPRSLRLDRVWQEYLQDMAGKAGLGAFTVPWILDCGGFGFEEYIERRPVSAQRADLGKNMDPDGSKDSEPVFSDFYCFYYRTGFLLGIAYALQGNDLHAENLIACGDYPVLIDLETGVRVCANTVLSDLRDKMAGRRNPKRYRFDSVIRTNLLPFLTMGREIHPGNDALISRTASSKNLPYGNEGEGQAGEYAHAILEGFCLAYDTVKLHGISPAFAGCCARFLVRNTSAYHDIQVWLYQGGSVRERRIFEQRLSCLEKLYECVERGLSDFETAGKSTMEYMDILEKEKEALRRGYIPRLTVKLSSLWLGADTEKGTLIADLIGEKAAAMNHWDREQQCRRIRIALNAGIQPERLYYACDEAAKAYGLYGKGALDKLIKGRILYWIKELDRSETVEGIVVARKDMRYYLTSLPWNMMEGIPGLLPFLAAWYFISRDPAAFALFDRIARKTRRHLCHTNLAAYKPGLSEGLEGILRMTQLAAPLIQSEDLTVIHDMVLNELLFGSGNKGKADDAGCDPLYYGTAAKAFVLALEEAKAQSQLSGKSDEKFESGLMNGMDGVLFPSFFRGEGGWLYLLLFKCYPDQLFPVLG